MLAFTLLHEYPKKLKRGQRDRGQRDRFICKC